MANKKGKEGYEKIRVCVRKRNAKSEKDLQGESREMATEQRKEDGRFNNSQTPASSRKKSVLNLDPSVLHTCRIIQGIFVYTVSICVFLCISLKLIKMVWLCLYGHLSAGLQTNKDSLVVLEQREKRRERTEKQTTRHQYVIMLFSFIHSRAVRCFNCHLPDQSQIQSAVWNLPQRARE